MPLASLVGVRDPAREPSDPVRELADRVRGLPDPVPELPHPVRELHDPAPGHPAPRQTINVVNGTGYGKGVDTETP